MFIQRKNILFYNFRSYLRRHKRSKSRYYSYRSSLKKPSHAAYSLPYYLVTVNIGLVKDKVFGGIYSDILVIELIILKDLFCPKITVSYDYSVLKVSPKTAYKMKLLGVYTSRYFRTGKGLLEIFIQFFEFF